MLIYLIIAAELAILYTVFWYVYVRDPMPYKIVGNPWGKYGDPSFTAGGADPTLPFTVEKQDEAAQWWHSAASPEQFPEDVAYGSGDRIERVSSLQYRRLTHRRQPFRHGATEHGGQSEMQGSAQEGAFISRVLGMFGRTLDAFNVRVP